MPNNEIMYDMLKKRRLIIPARDMLVILVLGGLVYCISVFTSAHERFDQWVGDRRFAGLHLDEIFILLIFFGFAFSVFGVRRWREADREIVLRTQIEATLQESEKKFRTLADKSVAGIYLVQDDKFRYVNPVLAEIFGYAVEEITDRMGPMDLVQPDDWPVVRENLRKRLAGETESIHYNFRGIRKNRELLYVEVYGSRTIYQGQPAVIGTLLDVTERKRKAEAMKRNEERILRQSYELAAMNVDLLTLHKVASAISHTLDRKSLFKNVLNAITDLEVLKVKRQAGIFIVKGDRLDLVAHLGHSEVFLDMHMNMTVNDCLCGLAARTGEIVICKDSHADGHHTIQYPGMAPHGHIIIPLKTADKVVGVLYLYLAPDTEVGERIITTLGTIGNQIGIAINNSLLYEETKELSLHDPLTKVANRNLMNIELEKNFARSKRFGSPLSIIMLDLDNFKKYNDTYGHTAGDKLLVETAGILLKEVREIDLVVRYGGEEFLFLLPEAEMQDAYEVAERTRKSVEKNTGVTISIGISSYSPEAGHWRELVKSADTALYQAKQKGKNRIETS